MASPIIAQSRDSLDRSMQNVLIESTAFDMAVRQAQTVTEALWLARRGQVLIAALSETVNQALLRADRLCGVQE